MAITPLGFEGSVNDVAYSRRSRFEGAQFPIVADRGDFQVSVNSGADRTVNVAAGTACAHAIMATSDAVESEQLSAVATAGATRWDAIVLRYNWNANTVEVTKVEGAAGLNSPAVMPSGLNSTVGDVFDQVLALVQITQGQTVPSSVIDMRLWASKMFLAPSLAALPSAAAAPYGSYAELVDGSKYRRLLDAANAPSWIGQSSGMVEINGPGVFTPATGWVLAAGTNRCRHNPVTGETQQTISLRRTGAALTSPASSNISDTPLGTLLNFTPTDFQPIHPQYAAGSGSSGSYLPCSGTVNSSGVCTLTSLWPDQDLNPLTAADAVSVRFSLHYMRRI